MELQSYVCALLQDLYNLQQHVLQGLPLPSTPDNNLNNPTQLFTKLQTMDVNTCFNFSENIYFLMLSFHCPTAKTLRALLNEEEVEETLKDKEPFTTEAAKNLKQEHPSASMPQLVSLAVARYRCAPQEKNTIWYLPDQHFSVFSPYMHVIVTSQQPTFRSGQTQQKHCCFTDTNASVVNNGFRQHAEYCAALNMLFPPTIPLSVKYQEYQDREGVLEEIIKSNIQNNGGKFFY